MIQSAILHGDIVANPGFHIYVVNAPRIILTYQLLKEVYTYLVTHGIEARYHFTHSGSAVDESDLEKIRIDANLAGDDIPFSEIESTTSSLKLCEAMEAARKLSLPLVIFSTYNSAGRIEDARAMLGATVSIVLNDEAHYLVQERFYDTIEKLKSDRCYFFTATTRKGASDQGRGMNNTAAYGEVLYTLKPRDAIDRGKMVRPRIHAVKTDGVRTDEDFDRSVNLVVLNAFKQHKLHFETHHPRIVPKVLVSTRGAKDMDGFLKSNECKELRAMGVDVFAISSTEIGNDVNGSKVKRQEFLKRLCDDGVDSGRMMLVLHYDILTEGINIPGFTSCMPLRNLNKGRFIQTFGRAARVDPRDRARLDSGEIAADDVGSMAKPYAYVILPDITTTNRDDFEQMRSIVTELRDYGFDPSEDVVGDLDPEGIGEDDALDGLNSVGRKGRTLGQIINDYRAEIELEAIAKLAPFVYLDRNVGAVDVELGA